MEPNKKFKPDPKLKLMDQVSQFQSLFLTLSLLTITYIPKLIRSNGSVFCSTEVVESVSETVSCILLKEHGIDFDERYLD